MTEYLAKERFILAHDFRGFVPWLLASVVSGPLVKLNCHGGEYVVH